MVLVCNGCQSEFIHALDCLVLFKPRFPMQKLNNLDNAVTVNKEDGHCSSEAKANILIRFFTKLFVQFWRSI